MTQQHRRSGSDRTADTFPCGRAREALVPVLTSALVLAVISYPAFSQTRSALNAVHPLNGPLQAANVEELGSPGANPPENSAAPNDPTDPNQPEAQGLVHRGVTRILRDQKELYSAPFQRSNFKWDAIVLAGTGALIATDRRIERHLPGGNVDIYTNVSNVALGGTAAALALSWGHGIKTHNEHLKEMGSLEVEALVNTFLVYTP
ncbi:MAG: hypothetical protein JO061_21340, partial [Acidobacteriaceae bacterium]|nr:hypothetical protein [Acidobacteriaceae bacterium]